MTDDDLERDLRVLMAEAAAGPDARFATGFAERVVASIARDRASQPRALESALIRQATRMLPALLAASMALVAWNWKSAGDTADSPIAAALGLQPVTIAAAVGGGALVGAEALQ